MFMTYWGFIDSQTGVLKFLMRDLDLLIAIKIILFQYRSVLYEND